jgi:hypothetical protein
MTYRMTLALIAAAVAAATTTSPVTAQTAQTPTTVQQCRWEVPLQFGPRAPVQAPRWTCTRPPAEKARGHYELYWPHWASQRALPPVRIWVPDR